MSTGIEWTDETWNPTTGCTKVSPGCDNCYAEVMYERFNGKGSFATVKMHSSRLAIPFHWRKPRKVFVNSMSDLFHQDVTDFFIAEVFAVMALNPRHTFQILTKRHSRMRSLLASESFFDLVRDALIVRDRPVLTSWPLPNVWLGVSVENQQWADIRIPALLDTPAAIRFLSCEPLLGPIDLMQFLHVRPIGEDLTDLPLPPSGAEACGLPALHWVIVGGESGHGARPMNPDWVRSLRDQCQQARVPYLYKQWGGWAPVPPAEARPSDTIITPAGQTMPWSSREDLVPEVARRSWVLRRVGKKAAGRELDGRIHDGYPAERVPA